jgi:hypothetical protein
MHVFAIVLCAFEVFAGFPILARSIKVSLWLKFPNSELFSGIFQQVTHAF